MMIKKVVGTLAESPVRCIDIGGWLDTWFSKYGSIVNLSVLTRPYNSQGPFRGIEVLVNYAQPTQGQGTINVYAADPAYDVTVSVDDLLSNNFDHTNLLLAVLYLIEKKCLHKKDLQIRIGSPIRPGASLGTSASVAVSLIRATTDNRLNDNEIAMLAWQAETKVMGGQSGTQDQFAAALPGAVKRIDITEFPKTMCRIIKIDDKTRTKLNEGMITVFYGSHDSSGIHRQVIDKIEQIGPGSPELQPFRPLSDLAEKAILKGDLKSFGQVMQKNTEAQKNLCRNLISPRAEAIIALGIKFQTLGWKINGAGGAGGSITLLFASRKKAVSFYENCKLIHRIEKGFEYYEHQLI